MNRDFLAGYLAALGHKAIDEDGLDACTECAQAAWDQLVRPNPDQGMTGLVKLLQREARKQNIPYDKFDPECVPLCKAINALPGIWTTESCCGHARHEFRIFMHFSAHDLRGLLLLTRAVDHRYGGHAWDLTLEIGDVPDPNNPAQALTLCLTSPPGWVGQALYEQANSMAENIALHLNHKNFLHGFGLDSLYGLLPIPPSAPEWMKQQVIKEVCEARSIDPEILLGSGATRPA